MPLLTSGNRDLRRDRIFTWTLPAWVTHLDDGRTVNTCPSAGACADLCYARRGSYRFSNVRAAHHRNLLRVLDDLEAWESELTEELRAKKYRGGTVRIHDAGDFFSDEYLEAWLRVIEAYPDVTFYAYTKEVERFRRLVEPRNLSNFKYVFSYGGRQDDAIELSDRQADVFPDDDSLTSAGFTDQASSDLLAITGPPRVGIVVNNHAGMKKKMNGQSFKELQAGRHPRRTRKSNQP